LEIKAFSEELVVSKKKSSLFQWLKWCLGLSLLLLILSLAGIGGILYYFSQDLPSLEAIGDYAPSQATRVYSDDGRVVGQYFIEKRVFVPISRMPKHLTQAFLAVEDARFYQHKGFDPIRIVRAFIKNVESLKIRQGASTITQQVTRSLFLTSERTIERKVKELILARKMETRLSKDEILEIYLNQIYFGHGAYGIQVASKTYFGKDVSEVTLEEAAFLAGLPKAPNDYSPYRHPERAKSRQQIVLKRMLAERFITQEAYSAAYEKDLFFKKLHSGEDKALYFKEYVRQYLISRYGDDLVYKGGLNVYTTLNEKMQEMAESSLKEGLRQLDKRQGYRGAIRKYEEEKEASSTRKMPLKEGDFLEARVISLHSDYAVVESKGVSGKIPLKEMLWAARRLTGPDIRKDRTLIDSPSPIDLLEIDDIILVRLKEYDPFEETFLFSLEQEPLVEGGFVALNPKTGAVSALVGGFDFKRSEYNRAVMAHRQPGSAFKPIIYGTAIERGYTSASILIDNPVIFADSGTRKVWKPQNYEKKFYGPTTLRDALTHSRNLATVKLLRKIGIKNVEKYAQRLGIKSPLARDLSLALGSSGISLLEMTSAFGVYANEGARLEPVLVLSVTDSQGRTLESHEMTPEQVVTREDAYVLTNILEDVIQRGTAKRARVIGRPVAGKTGTTNEFTDAWFVGYTPNLASGIWVGFDNNRSLGYKESGGRAALPIWVSFMEKALSLLPVIPFSIPDEIVYAKIDRETGYLAEEGTAGEVEIFVKGTEPTEVKADFTSPSEFFRLDQEMSAF